MRIVAASSLLFLGLVLVFLRPADGEPPPVPPKPNPGGNGQERKDQYGDPLPDGAVARLGTVRLRHPDVVHDLRFSPDGKTIASVGGDGSIRLWEASTGKLVRQFLGHKGDSVGSVAFSGDGRYLVSADFIGPARLWEVETGKEVRQLGGEQAKIRKVAFSPDNKTVATWSNEDGRIRLWDAATGESLRPVGDQRRDPHCLAFSSDGRLLAAALFPPGDGGATIQVWEAATGKELCRVERGRGEGAGLLVFSPDGKTLAATHGDKTVRLWGVDSGKELRRFVGHLGYASGLAFQDADTLVTTGQDDGTIRFWDTTTGEERRRLDDKPMFLPGPLRVSPDGKTMALGGYSGCISLRDSQTGKERPALETNGGCYWLAAFLPDGKTLVAQGLDLNLRLWDVTTGKVLGEFEGHPRTPVGRLALTSDRKTLVLGDNDTTIYSWDIATRKLGSRLPLKTEWLGNFALAPDRKVLATGGGSPEGPVVSLWDLATGNRLRQLHGAKASIRAITFSRDGKFLACGCGEEDLGGTNSRRMAAIHIWEIATGDELCRLTGHHGQIEMLEFSPDGRTLAAVGLEDRQIHLWEIATKSERCLLGKHDLGNIRIAYSHDGKWLASGGSDQRVRIWDVFSGAELWRSPEEKGRIRWVGFSPDIRYLVSVGSNNTAICWEVQTLVQTGQPAQKPLTDDEMEDYWAELAGSDAAAAFRAVRSLVIRPAQAVDLVKSKLRPFVLEAREEDQIKRWVGALDAEEFFVRSMASEELAKLGQKAEPLLVRALTETESREARSRIEALLKKLPEPMNRPEWRRFIRAVEVLESVGNDEAREVLKEVSKGVPEAGETREAKSALTRLERERRK